VTAVRVHDLWKAYGDVSVLERINLEVSGPAFLSVVGASGCGKTTFLRMLLSQETPTRGTIEIDGEPLPPEPGPERGVVFQRYSTFPHLTVLQNVVFGLDLAGAPLTGRLFGARRRRAEEEAMVMIEAVGLTHVRAAYPSALSGGMQQRLAIAQTLVRRPRLLLLDEPFGALDPGTRAAMHDLILGLWADIGMTVFMVTHDLKEGFALGTRVLVFDKVRQDPDDPAAYGATITYDLPVDRNKAAAARPPDPAASPT